MKKFFLAILVFVMVGQLSAQKFGGGIEGGFVYSWLGTDSKKASPESGRFSFTYGAFLDINIAENFAFSTGFNIDQVGGSIRYDENINLNWDKKDYSILPDAKVTYKIQYLELPITIKGKTKEIGYITYFGKIGINPMIAVKSRADIDGTVYDGSTLVSDKTDLNIKENINMFNIGWHLGGGIEYSLGGTTSIIAELQYTNNFLSFTNKNVTVPTGNSVDITVSMITLKAGIKF